MSNESVYLVELTEHKRNYFVYYPFVIWNCFKHRLDESSISRIEANYGKIKAVWKCDSVEDASNWREEILKMRGQEDLI